MNRSVVLFFKAHVPAHTRRLPNGKTVSIPAYDTSTASARTGDAQTRDMLDPLPDRFRGGRSPGVMFIKPHAGGAARVTAENKTADTFDVSPNLNNNTVMVENKPEPKMENRDIVSWVASNGKQISISIGLDGQAVARMDGKVTGRGLGRIKPQTVGTSKVVAAIGNIALTQERFDLVDSALKQDRAAKQQKAAGDLETNVPGATELIALAEAVGNDQDRYSEQFSQMMEDEQNDGVRPPARINESNAALLQQKLADNPRAALYLRAKQQSESASWADNIGKGAAGKRAMDILVAGGAIEEAEKALAARRGITD